MNAVSWAPSSCAKPATGYGYIRRGAAVPGFDGCYGVERCVEKPGAATAQGFLDKGGCS